jgi:uncharacterized RDD family membrane protein YckC
MFQTSDILKKRIYALTADFAIVIITNYFLIASFTNFIKTVFFHLTFRTQMLLIHKFVFMTSISLTILMFAYFSIFCFVTNGRTMGKTLFGLRVVSPRGEITLKESMQRSFAYFVCAMFGSFLFALSFIRKDDKSLADILSGTSVAYYIKDGIQASGTEFQLSLIEMKNNTEEDLASLEQKKSA